MPRCSPLCRASVEAEGAQLMLVAPTISGVTDSGRAPLVIDEAVAGGPSVLFDAIAVILTADGAAAMAQNPAAKDFVTDAHAALEVHRVHGHLHAIVRCRGSE